jgi:hypothetical protein
MGPHIVNVLVKILQQCLSIVLDFPANTMSYRWTRSLIAQANVAHELQKVLAAKFQAQAKPAVTLEERRFFDLYRSTREQSA